MKSYCQDSCVCNYEQPVSMYTECEQILYTIIEVLCCVIIIHTLTVSPLRIKKDIPQRRSSSRSFTGAPKLKSFAVNSVFTERIKDAKKKKQLPCYSCL